MYNPIYDQLELINGHNCRWIHQKWQPQPLPRTSGPIFFAKSPRYLCLVMELCTGGETSLTCGRNGSHSRDALFVPSGAPVG